MKTFNKIKKRYMQKKINKDLDTAKTVEEKVAVLKKYYGPFRQDITSLRHCKKAIFAVQKFDHDRAFSEEDYDVLKKYGFSTNILYSCGVRAVDIYKDAPGEKITSLINDNQIKIYDIKKLSPKHQKELMQRHAPDGLDSYAARIFLQDVELTKMAVQCGLNTNGYVEDYAGNANDYYTNPYLTYANSECAEILLQNGANPDEYYREFNDFGECIDKRCILEKSITDKEKVALLLKYGANPFLVTQKLDPNNPTHQLILDARKKGKDYYISGQAHYDAITKYANQSARRKLIPILKKKIGANQNSDKEDLLQLKCDKLKEKLGNKVGKTGNTQTNTINISHVRIADEQVKISKAIMKKAQIEKQIS